MGRLLLGVIAGALGGAAIIGLDVAGYTLAGPLLALALALILGIALGWRRARAGSALGAGLLVGGVAGLLMGGGQLAGVWQALSSPRSPDWLLALVPGGDLFWALAGSTAALCVLLASLLSGAVAGLVAGWTGYHARPNVRLEPLDTLLPGAE